MNPLVWQAISWSLLVLAALPALMILRNLALYRPARSASGDVGPVSVLIPARDEAAGIEAAVRSVLAAGDRVTFEVVVLDDHSTDGTADVVQRLAREDERVRLELAPVLPTGWSGKQHACWVLAQRARYDTLVWIDADVRLSHGALSRIATELNASGAQLVSGVPRQVTESWLEVLIVPQVLLVLLGYLPMGRMRMDNRPALGAGCGQLFIAEKQAYFACGGHEGIKASRHDGVELPRLFREAGFRTDLFDATDVATCRMYTNAAQTWHGFSKNATAGMGSPRAIGVWTVLLLGGHVLPWVLLVATFTAAVRNGMIPPQLPEAGALFPPGFLYLWIAGSAWVLSCLSSGLIAWRFKQGVVAALLRPFGVLALVLMQWVALTREFFGHRPTWRGRKLEA